MGKIKNIIEYIEKLENEKFEGGTLVEQRLSFLSACESIKMKVYEHLSGYQIVMLKELVKPEIKDKSLDNIWGQALTDILELLDLGLLESTETPNEVRISDKGIKLIESL